MEKLTPDKRGSVDRYHSPQPKIKVCKYHGETPYVLRKSKTGNYWRCKKCAVMHSTKRRQRVKQKLVNLFGGACERCGYNKSMRALAFHHKEPDTKKFGIGNAKVIGWDALLNEAKKCALLCANCHAEIEDSSEGK